LPATCLSLRAAAKWFRAPALASPITWQIDCERRATIGGGNMRLVVMESIAFIVFVVAGFLYAARCLQRRQ
jgi:ABC-type multidrug transport system permease subunit